MINLYTKYEVCMFTHYKDMKGDKKCKNWGCLGVRGHPRSSETSLFDRTHVTSSTLIETMHLSSTVSSYSVFHQKWPILTHPTCICHPLGDDPVRVSPRSLKGENFKSPGAIVWCHLHHHTFSRFDTIPDCDRHTYGQTDGRPDTRRWHIPCLA